MNTLIRRKYAQLALYAGDRLLTHNPRSEFLVLETEHGADPSVLIERAIRLFVANCEDRVVEAGAGSLRENEIQAALERGDFSVEYLGMVDEKSPKSWSRVDAGMARTPTGPRKKAPSISKAAVDTILGPVERLLNLSNEELGLLTRTVLQLGNK